MADKESVQERRTYRVEDIAKILNIGRTSSYKLVNEGHFHSVRISKKSFDEWLDALKTE